MDTSIMTQKAITVADEVLDAALNPSPSIVIDGITVSFKTPKGIFTAIKDISLAVKKGEIVSFIGHSGCGKSTLMGTISGMVKATKGVVTANGKIVTKPGPDRGLVFQNYSLLPWLTVYQNIYTAVDSAVKNKSAKEKKEIVENNLHMVHLWTHKDKLPGQLSGGMKQRVAICHKSRYSFTR